MNCGQKQNKGHYGKPLFFNDLAIKASTPSPSSLIAVGKKLYFSLKACPLSLPPPHVFMARLLKKEHEASIPLPSPVFGCVDDLVVRNGGGDQDQLPVGRAHTELLATERITGSPVIHGQWSCISGTLC